MDTKTDTEEKGEFVYNKLVNWGVPAVLAAVLVAVGYALLVFFGVLTLDSCSVTLDVLPDGTQHFDGVITAPARVDASEK